MTIVVMDFFIYLCSIKINKKAMGQYADDCIDNGIDSMESWSIPTFNVSSPYVKDYNKLNEITKGVDYLLRNFKVSIDVVVKCIGVTDKAVLFEVSGDFETKQAGKQFWVPKSIIYVDKMELETLPQSKVYYIPNWSTLTIIN